MPERKETKTKVFKGFVWIIRIFALMSLEKKSSVSYIFKPKQKPYTSKGAKGIENRWPSELLDKHRRETKSSNGTEIHATIDKCKRSASL